MTFDFTYERHTKFLEDELEETKQKLTEQKQQITEQKQQINELLARIQTLEKAAVK